MAELGHNAASEYAGQRSKMWSLLNSLALVKTEEVALFKQVFGTSNSSITYNQNLMNPDKSIPMKT